MSLHPTLDKPLVALSETGLQRLARLFFWGGIGVIWAFTPLVLFLLALGVIGGLLVGAAYLAFDGAHWLWAALR